MSFQIVHHMAAIDQSPNPPNSLAAVQASLQAQAAVIEVDLTPLDGNDFLLVHDPVLESETSGVGNVNQCTPQHAKTYRIKYRDTITDHPPALLSEVIALIAKEGGFAGQYSGRPPGPQVLARGLERVAVLAKGLRNLEEMR